MRGCLIAILLICFMRVGDLLGCANPARCIIIAIRSWGL